MFWEFTLISSNFTDLLTYCTLSELKLKKLFCIALTLSQEYNHTCKKDMLYVVKLNNKHTQHNLVKC